jgi:hypothetical protein
MAASFAGNEVRFRSFLLGQIQGNRAMASAHKNTHAEAKKDRSKSEEEKLDQALDGTFPASDPPSMIDPARHVGSGKTTGAGSAAQDKSGHR